MSKKKETNRPVSQEENTRIQHLLEQFHAIAETLHNSTSEDEARAALAGTDTLSEAAQMVLLKALSKEKDTDAADILNAVNQLSPLKEVRKEARRSLIRLEEARIYPHWRLPIERVPLIQINSSSPMRLWEGTTAGSHEPGGVDSLLGDDLEEEDDEFFYDPEDAVYEFIEAWTDEDFEYAYDLLATSSDLREGLARVEWVERRKAWAQQAHPDELETSFTRLREQGQAEFDLPSAFSGTQVVTEPLVTSAADHAVVEIGWSLELADTPLNETPKELPRASIVYKETKRHWFWTSYTLVQERNEEEDEDDWRIQSMSDEAAVALDALPLEELQSRTEKLGARLQELVKMQEEENFDFSTLSNFDTLLGEPYEVGTELLHYEDALIARMPEERSTYEVAADHALEVEEYERAAAYLELIVDRFTEKRAETLHKLAITQLAISDHYSEVEDDERSERFHELSLASLRRALTIQDNFFTRLMLARMLFQDDQLDEADEHLRYALAQASDEGQKSLAEFALGDTAMAREDYAQALQHYRQVIAFDASDAEAWHSVGAANQKLGNMAEAETSYQHALELDPTNERTYISLGRIYVEGRQWSKAREILEQGLRANPDSAELRTYLALTLIQKGDRRRAASLLKEAENIQPGLEITRMVRQALKETEPGKKKRR